MRHPEVATTVVRDMNRNSVPATSKEILRTCFSDLKPKGDLARGYVEY